MRVTTRGIPFSEELRQRGQLGAPLEAGPAYLLSADDIAARRHKALALDGEVLVVTANPRVTEEAARRGGVHG